MGGAGEGSQHPIPSLCALSSFWQNREENACEPTKKWVWGGGRKIGKRACPYTTGQNLDLTLPLAGMISGVSQEIKRKPQGKQLYSPTGTLQERDFVSIYTQGTGGNLQQELLIRKLQRANQGQGGFFLVVFMGSWRGSIPSLGGSREMVWLTSQGLL